MAYEIKHVYYLASAPLIEVEADSLDDLLDLRAEFPYGIAEGSSALIDDEDEYYYDAVEGWVSGEPTPPASELPEFPSSNGTYTLKVTVSSGEGTLSWVKDDTGPN